MLLPAIYGNNHTGIYYNIAKSLPADLDSNIANEKLSEDFDMSVMHIIMMDKNMDGTEKAKMLDEVKNVDGVKWTIGINTLLGASVPDSMIPDNLKSMPPGRSVRAGLRKFQVRVSDGRGKCPDRPDQ